MQKIFKKEIFILILFIFVGLAVRTINYKLHLDFSTDQAVFANNALRIYQNKELTLLGPTASFLVQGRRLLQGSVIFYFNLIFLIIGKFDPIYSSYAFTIFTMLMVIPLYFGVKWLSNKKTAILISILFSLFPYFLNYSRFLWNSNFQYSLTPILILFLGLYNREKDKKIFWLIASGIWSGFLTMFHYQFFIVNLILIVYLFFFKKIGLKKTSIFFGSMIIGFLPMIIFEIKNDFYALRIINTFLGNTNKFAEENAGSDFFKTPHYFLNILFVSLVLTVTTIRLKLDFKHLIWVALILFGFDLYLYLPKPSHGFGMAKDWNYPSEAYAHQIIEESRLSDFNVTNLAYDTIAEVQKYLLKKDGIADRYSYFNSKYLFVIAKNETFVSDPAYEVASFKPSFIISFWEINNSYNLYLLKRSYPKI